MFQGKKREDENVSSGKKREDENVSSGEWERENKFVGMSKVERGFQEENQ